MLTICSLTRSSLTARKILAEKKHNRCSHSAPRTARGRTPQFALASRNPWLVRRSVVALVHARQRTPKNEAKPTVDLHIERRNTHVHAHVTELRLVDLEFRLEASERPPPPCAPTNTRGANDTATVAFAPLRSRNCSAINHKPTVWVCHDKTTTLNWVLLS